MDKIRLNKLKRGQTIKDFLAYEYRKDNDKYYIQRIGKGKYSSTYFTRLNNKYPELFEIVSRGNDATRGGKIGDWVIAKPTQLFLDNFVEYIDLPHTTFGGFYNGVFDLNSLDTYEQEDEQERTINWDATAQNIYKNIVEVMTDKLRGIVRVTDSSLFRPKSYNYLTDVITLEVIKGGNIEKAKETMSNITDVDLWHEVEIYDCIVWDE